MRLDRGIGRLVLSQAYTPADYLTEPRPFLSCDSFHRKSFYCTAHLVLHLYPSRHLNTLDKKPNLITKMPEITLVATLTPAEGKADRVITPSPPPPHPSLL